MANDFLSTRQPVENLIIGGGFSGCLAAWILANEKKSGVLLEKSSSTAGMCGSFQDSFGNPFDYGRHAFNAGRSDFASEFFTQSLNGEVRKFAAARGLLLDGSLYPYGKDLSQWSGALKDKISIDRTAPKVGVGSSKQALAKAYGSWFANFIFDEVLTSFPTLKWRLDRGCPAEELMDWIFPWFFPLSDREADPNPDHEKGVFSAESRDYHYQARHSQIGEEMLYPTGNHGFTEWLDRVLEQTGEYIDVQTGIDHLDFKFDPGSYRLESIGVGDITYIPENVFWCAPLPILCQAFGWQQPVGESQTFLLGSFTFDKPLEFQFHEVLTADANHPMSRITFPGFFNDGKNTATVQVEYLTLTKQSDGASDDEWLEKWQASLKKIGLVPADSKPLFTQLKRMGAGVATNEDLIEFSNQCRQRLQQSATNLVVPGLTCTPDNLSRRLPVIFSDVYQGLDLPWKNAPNQRTL